jgi:hypothetical protein
LQAPAKSTGPMRFFLGAAETPTTFASARKRKKRSVFAFFGKASRSSDS